VSGQNIRPEITRAGHEHTQARQNNGLRRTGQGPDNTEAGQDKVGHEPDKTWARKRRAVHDKGRTTISGLENRRRDWSRTRPEMFREGNSWRIHGPDIIKPGWSRKKQTPSSNRKNQGPEESRIK